VKFPQVARLIIMSIAFAFWGRGERDGLGELTVLEFGAFDLCK
jgi:hypothetical protein